MTPAEQIRAALDEMTDDVMRAPSVFICQQIVGEATRETLPDLVDALEAEHADLLSRLTNCGHDRDSALSRARLVEAERVDRVWLTRDEAKEMGDCVQRLYELFAIHLDERIGDTKPTSIRATIDRE